MLSYPLFFFFFLISKWQTKQPFFGYSSNFGFSIKKKQKNYLIGLHDFWNMKFSSRVYTSCRLLFLFLIKWRRFWKRTENATVGWKKGYSKLLKKRKKKRMPPCVLHLNSSTYIYTTSVYTYVFREEECGIFQFE